MSTFKIYLAGPFQWIDRLNAYADQLALEDIHVNSRWLDEKADPKSHVSDHSPEYLRQTATNDLADIIDCDVMVLFTPGDEDLKDVLMGKRTWARGGRHFESGYVFALRMIDQMLQVTGVEGPNHELVICGPRENIFHYMDGVRQFDTWEETKLYLLSLKPAAVEMVN